MAVSGLIGDIHNLDDLVGTDLWVRARIKHKQKAYSYCMIKILNSNEATSENGYEYTEYTFLSIDIRRLSPSDVLYCTAETRDYILDGKGITLPSWDIKLLEPLELVPEEEMFHITD